MANNRLKELLEQVQTERGKLNKEELLPFLKNSALEVLEKQLKNIENEQKIEKRNLVFIGSIGSGKTTALCSLLDLVDEEGKELLVTGAGGSTLSEVEIQLSEDNNSKIEINFISKEELKNLIVDFAAYIRARINPKDKRPRGELSQEVLRAIRNIVGLKKKKKEDAGVNLYKEKLKKYSSSEKDKEKAHQEFIDNLLKKIKDTYPKEENFDREGGFDKILTKEGSLSEKEFIKNKFSAINNVTLDNYSIPTKIIISLAKKEFGENKIWKYYEKIIDTKGLDKATERKDIKNYLLDSKNILFFATTFANAPDANIFYQIENFSKKAKNNAFVPIEKRGAILVLPRGDEPCHKVGAEGDYEEGIAIAADNINDKLLPIKDTIVEKNILFFDAKEPKENTKEEVVLAIKNLVEGLDKSNLKIEELTKAKDEILKVVLSTDSKNTLISALKKINLLEFIIRDINFGELFSTKFYEIAPHWNTMHAINTRKGVWEWRGIDLYFDAQNVLIAGIAQSFNEKIAKIKKYIEKIASSSLQPINSYIQKDLLDLIYNFETRIKEVFKTHLENNEFRKENNSFWYYLTGDEIRGEGYTTRVISTYREHLSNLYNFIQQLIEKEWNNLTQELAQKYGGDLLEEELRDTLSFELRSFAIENYQGIDKIEEITIPKSQKCIFLTGKNGYGKTSILRAIAVGLTGKTDDGRVLIDKDKDTKISISYWDSTEGKKEKRTLENDQPLEHLVAYGANRHRLGREMKESKIYHLMNDDGQFLNIEEKLRELEKGNEQQQIYYSNIRSKLLYFLDDYLQDIRVFREGIKVEVEYLEKGKEKREENYIRFDKLATGFKSVIGLVGDIIWRLAKGNYDNLKSLVGIVIIDEFDMHLHPQLQRDFLIKLNKTFPKVQFIISTHSPIPFLGAPANSTLIKVDRDEKANITAEVLDIDFSVLLPNAILSSPVFGFEELIPYAIPKKGKYVEIESYYSNIKKAAKSRKEFSEYLTEDRMQEILALIPKSDEE